MTAWRNCWKMDGNQNDGGEEQVVKSSSSSPVSFSNLTVVWFHLRPIQRGGDGTRKRPEMFLQHEAAVDVGITEKQIFLKA